MRKTDKLNHKGMTLIEIIVAMAILAVVVVPTLRIFASTAGTTLRSRDRQRATSVAEGVMESFKAYNLEALCEQFDKEIFEGVVTTAGTSMSVAAKFNGSGTYETPLREDKTLKGVADVYEFNVKNAASEGHLYDVYVEVTPIIAPTVLKMDNTNEYSDAIICLAESNAVDARTELETMVKDDITDNYATYYLGATELDPTIDVEFSDFKRVIDVTVSDDGNTQTVKYKVTCTAKAEAKCKVKLAGTLTPKTRNYDETFLKYEMILDVPANLKEVVAYDNENTISGESVDVKKCKLNQILLYYFPSYPSSFGTGAEDVINIGGALTNIYSPFGASDPKARGYEPLRFVVAKQMSTTITGADLNLGEVAYKVSVNNTVSGGGDVEFRSNLEENLSPLGSVISSPAVSGFYDGISYPEYAPGKLLDKVQDRVALLYEVEIHVYEAGTMDEVALFEGTMNE